MVHQFSRGKAVIVGIFLLAFVLSGYAWWHQYQQGRRCREFLGTDAVTLIRLASQVELLRLEPESTAEDDGIQPAGILRIGGTTVGIARRVEITGVPGLLHARHALLQDLNYRWGAPPADGVGPWSFALRFAQDGESAVIAFDPQGSRIGLDGTERTEPFLPELMVTFAEKSIEWETRAAGLRPATPVTGDAGTAAPPR